MPLNDLLICPFPPILFKLNLLSRVQIVGWQGSSKSGWNASSCEISGKDSVKQTGTQAGRSSYHLLGSLWMCYALMRSYCNPHSDWRLLGQHLSRCWMLCFSTTFHRICYSCARDWMKGSSQPLFWLPDLGFLCSQYIDKEQIKIYKSRDWSMSLLF